MRARGFSIIELMVALAIFAIILMLALPAYNEFIANSQIRSASESLLNGARVAQSQAVKSNLPTILTVNGSGWSVSTDDPDNPGTPLFSESYAFVEGARNATITVEPSGAAAVTYGGLGRIIPNEDGTDTITFFDVTNTTYSGSRPLRVLISDSGTGGGTRMCDPAIDPKDPQGCP